MLSKQALKLRTKIANLPPRPGVYEFLNQTGDVLYVGKAKNLRSRVRQYFQGKDNRPQIPFLMTETTDFKYTIVSSQLESAFLENTLIKRYHPKYNIDLKDDKNYAFIKIDYSAEIPQITYARKIDDESLSKIKDSKLEIKNLYFGPYSAAYKIRNTLNLVRKIFSFCSNTKVGSRPCFYYHMHRCPGVCVGKMTLSEYSRHLEKIGKFLQGNINSVYKEIKREMALASEQKKFEAAASLRDKLKALELLAEKQSVILTEKVDWDVISLAEKNGYFCINLFKIRKGKMFEKENFIYETSYQPGLKDVNIPIKNIANDAGKKEILQRFLERYYQEASFCPKIIFCQIQPYDRNIISQILKSRFLITVKVKVPKTGKMNKLISLGKLNAEDYIKNWLVNKATNTDKTNQALDQLKTILNLPAIPKRIEAYDISNIQGANAVGSMIVFSAKRESVSGEKIFEFQKSEYRKFKIRGKTTPDDFAMMKEMLSRRITRSQGNDKSQNLKNKFQINSKPWPLPDLIVIDGGKGQLNAALSVLQTTSLKSQAIPIIGLAKKIEEIFLPKRNEPILLGHDQPALQLLQKIRDEAHRFGITFHRNLRSKLAVKSALDEIPGVGPKTKKILKERFGTIKNIKLAQDSVLIALVGKALTKQIKENL